MSIRPFKIDTPQAQLDDLRQRVNKTIWPSVIGGQNYGGPALARMQNLAKQVLDFDWRKQETALNALPNFTTDIDGQSIHFIHVKSKVANATPLMLIHGWPGSIVEFLNHIEPLTDPTKHGGTAEDAVVLVGRTLNDISASNLPG